MAFAFELVKDVRNRNADSVPGTFSPADAQLSKQPNQERCALRKRANSNPIEPAPKSASVVGSGTALYG